MAVKRILTRNEQLANNRLVAITERCGAHTFVKVRLADVFPIERSGLSNHDYRFCLQSHFDFLVTDDDIQPQFAIELDDDSHGSAVQRRRDAQKNRLCEMFGLPLLRVTRRYLSPEYRDVDLLSWFIEWWFAAQAIGEAQAAGAFPVDEPIDPGGIISLPGYKRSFPLQLGLSARAEIMHSARTYTEQDPVPSALIIRDSADNLRAIGWIRCAENRYALRRTGMRAQRFPVMYSELLMDLLAVDLSRDVRAFHLSSFAGIPQAVADAAIKKLGSRGELYAAAGYGRGTL